MGRPFDTEVLEVLKPDRDRAIALIESCIQIRSQAGGRGAFAGRRGAGGQHIQPLLGGAELAGKELAFGPM